MGFKFNPFSGNFDQTGSGGGGGSAFFAGEVATYADLPLDGTAALNSRWLVRSNSGTWPFSSYKQAGVYVRIATVGSSRDNDYRLTDTSFHDVMSDSAFVLFDDGDATKNLKFQLSGIDTATTRTLTAPNASGTIQLTGHAAAHASSGSDPLFDQDLNTTSFPTFGDLSVTGAFDAGQFVSNGIVNIQGQAFFIDDGAPAIECGVPLVFTNGAEANSRTNLGLEIGTDVAAASHTHGNLSSDGKIGSTSGLPLVTTTAGAVTTLALGTANQVLRVNSGATGVEFADPSGGVTAVGTTLADILSVSGSDLVADDLAADKLYGWDDSAGKAIGFVIGSGLSVSGDTISVAGGGSTNIWIPASQWIPRTTNGCGVDSRETSTNRQNFDELLFDAGTDEFAQALVEMPSNYNNGTITARFYWTASSGSGSVIWGIQGRAFADDDALDTAAGTAQTVTDTLLAANDMHVSAATSAATIGGTPAANTPIQFQIYRDADAAGDTLGVDARLLGVEIIFN